VAAWLLLVPMTAVYVAGANGEPPPRLVTSRYTWWTPEQAWSYSDTGLARAPHLVQGVRLNCGGLFTTGAGEPDFAPAGPEACAALEAPRGVVTLVLVGLGALGLLGASLLPSGTPRAPERYQATRAQRRAWRKG
jgi:hypothetical protein